MRKRPSFAVIVVAAIALTSLLLGSYTGAYFWLGNRKDNWDISATPPYGRGELLSIWRLYERQWHATIFHPAAIVETQLRGIEVEAHERPGIKAYHPGWGIWQDFP